jgi:hypothetical protein
VQKIYPPLDDHRRAHFGCLHACTGGLLARLHTIARDPSSSSVLPAGLPAVTAALDVNGPWRGGGVRTSRSTA